MSTGLPHMLPDAPTFAEAMTTLGLGDGMRFVVYDSLGLFASGASVVDAARFRRHGRARPRWRPAAMAERRSSDRAGRPATAAAPLHAEARSLLRRGARRRAPGAGDATRRKSSMRGRPTVSRGARPSRAPAFARATSPAASTCPWPTSSSTAGSSAARRSRPSLPPMASISISRSSPPAARASARPFSRSRSRRRAGGSPASMTASWAEWGSRPDCPLQTGPARPPAG